MLRYLDPYLVKHILGMYNIYIHSKSKIGQLTYKSLSLSAKYDFGQNSIR